MTDGAGSFGPVRFAWAAVPNHERSTRGRRLLTRLVTDLTGAGDVEIFRRCERCGATDHGAPRVRGLPVAVSVSYAEDIVAVAAVRTADAAAVGVDIEADASEVRVAELAPLFAPRPPPDLRGWTLLEAALKADGRGLTVDPSTVRLEAGRAGTPAGSVVVAIPGQPSAVIAAPLDGPTGFVLSVAVRTAGAGGFPGVQAEPVRPATP